MNGHRAKKRHVLTAFESRKYLSPNPLRVKTSMSNLHGDSKAPKNCQTTHFNAL